MQWQLGSYRDWGKPCSESEQPRHIATVAHALQAMVLAILFLPSACSISPGQNYSVGGYVSTHSRDGYWGSNAIETISKGLQQELPGLRGFSPRNIKNMRIFYEQWSPYINRQKASNDLIINYTPTHYKIRQMTTAEFPIDNFMAVGFTNHVEILSKIKDFDERLFYITQCAHGSWTK